MDQSTGILEASVGELKILLWAQGCGRGDIEQEKPLMRS